jgi:hypothetical protein
MDKSGFSVDYSTAKIFKKHWRKIKDVKDVDFGKVYQYFQIQHIHRKFGVNETNLLAIFTVFEFLHNLNWLIFEINVERRKSVINKAARMEICAFKPYSFELYKDQIRLLKEGKIYVRQEVWNYVFDRLKVSDKKKKEIEKQAADKALNMMKIPYDIIGFIEKVIAGDYEIFEKGDFFN